MRLRNDYFNEEDSVHPKSTSSDGRRRGKPIDLIQKTITFVSSSLDRVLSKHDLCGPRLQLLTARQA